MLPNNLLCCSSAFVRWQTVTWVVNDMSTCRKCVNCWKSASSALDNAIYQQVECWIFSTLFVCVLQARNKLWNMLGELERSLKFDPIQQTSLANWPNFYFHLMHCYHIRYTPEYYTFLFNIHQPVSNFFSFFLFFTACRNYMSVRVANK